MYIPGGALDKSEEREIALSTSHSGCFDFPDEAVPVSFIYYVEPSGPFRKSVTIEIEHCCNLENDMPHNLTFGFAKSSTKVPPYKFQRLEGGKFPSDSSYGQVEISNFSCLCILCESGNVPREYLAHAFYKQFTKYTWKVVLVVSERLEECLQVCLYRR